MNLNDNRNIYPSSIKYISFPFPFLSRVFQFPIGWLETGSEFCKRVCSVLIIVFSTLPFMCEGGARDKGTSCRPLSKLISSGIQNSHSHQNILFTFENRKYLVRFYVNRDFLSGLNNTKLLRYFTIRIRHAQSTCLKRMLAIESLASIVKILTIFKNKI